MALRDQPYIPLYVQDVLTDEKLILCSAESHGIYLRLICILHKQETYGLLCLKQKHKQNESKFTNFASLLSRQMPFEQKQIERSLIELSEEDVIQITENELSQKRMIRDGELSLIRAEVGKKGGSNVTKQYGKSGFLYWMGDYEDKNKIGISVSPQNRLYRLRSDLKLKNFDIQDSCKVKDMGKAEDFAHNFFADLLDGEWVKINHENMKEKFVLLKAKLQANSENENEYENENENRDKKENKNISTFEQFWKAYPKKKSKGQAEKAFFKINPDEQLLAIIIATIERAKKSEDWIKEKGKYIPYPATWLNAKGWLDEDTETHPLAGVVSDKTISTVEMLEEWRPPV